MTIRSKTGRSHRGAVLILVLVMLSLLAMLAISLATTSVLDRSVSFNYIDEVRARLIAKAGIEHAIARIQAMVQRGQFEDQSLVYWGSKTEETGDPDVDTPLDKALNPSFAIEDEEIQNPDDSKTTPIRFNFDGREVGISGTMSSSTYGRHSDVYRLRVTDANGRINVNDGIFDPDVRKNVERILNHLGDACGVGDLGSTLIAKSPKNGYRSRRELREALGNDKYKRVGDHITPFAWTDHNVVNPVPISLATLGAYPVDYNERLSLYRYGRSQSASGAQISGHLVFAPDYAAPKGFGHAIYAQDEVNAQWIGRTARCPVNVNVASVQVLTALISDLRGVFMTERRKKNPGGGQYTFMYYPKMENRPPTSDVEPRGSELGYLYSTPAFQPPSGDKKTTNKAAYVGGVSAKTVAEEIVACRLRQKSTHGTIDYGAEWFGGPFRTWMQFNAFCDSLVTQGILADGRDIFYDFQPSNQGDGGSWSFGPDW
ncbi:MAG TPA: pilus assembly PilX N-terminal domain-containing protein, partial [Planctomycetota bacterium]|nr:pilus assembly PilX N-terminal domain-containing protein [Planctomycetota bacterium]